MNKNLLHEVERMLIERGIESAPFFIYDDIGSVRIIVSSEADDMIVLQEMRFAGAKVYIGIPRENERSLPS